MMGNYSWFKLVGTNSGSRLYTLPLAHTYSKTTQRLKLCCNDLEILKKRLLQEKIEILSNGGRLSFIDLNGINWDIYEKQLN
jgi:hypothetical protein